MLSRALGRPTHSNTRSGKCEMAIVGCLYVLVRFVVFGERLEGEKEGC